MAEATKYSTSYAAMATTALSGAVRARQRGGLRREAVWRCCGKDAVAGGVACAVRRVDAARAVLPEVDRVVEYIRMIHAKNAGAKAAE